MSQGIHKQYLIQTLKELVQINSVNPQLVDGAPGEREISHFITGILKKLGIDCTIDEIAPGRFNVTAVIKGCGNGKSLIINAHTDTVGVAGMDNPFSAKVDGGKLYGRGAMDMKASIAAMLAMAKSLVDNDIALQGDLILSFVADEEYGSIGTEHFLKHHTADAAIVTEPTGLDICTAHKGFGLYEITTYGKAAHGSRPDLGIDANMMMGKILCGLHALSKTLKEYPPHVLLGHPSLHVPVISGGSEPFTYAETCTINLERRTLPGETYRDIEAKLEGIIQKLSDQHKDFKATVDCKIWRDPFETDAELPIVKNLFDCIQKNTSNKPSYIGHHWWEDSGLFGKAGIDTVIIGPYGEGLHTHEEWVDIDSVIQLAEILTATAKKFCN